MSTAPSKWDAAGNTYLVVEEEVDADSAERLAREHETDGVLEVLRADGATAEVRVWNPDGTTAELSGNGARIAAAWLARRAGVPDVRVRVGERDVRAFVTGGDVRVELGPVSVAEIEIIDADGEQVELTPVAVGNPHAVIRVEPDREALLRLGPAIERHARFPERTNVQLIRVDSQHELTVRVWERGAGETAASGTSAVAAAAAAVANGWCESPVRVRMPGGVLFVELDEGLRATLTGPVARLS